MNSDLEWLEENLCNKSVDDQALAKRLLSADKEATRKRQELHMELFDSGRQSILSMMLDGGWIDPNFIDDEGTTLIGCCIRQAAAKASGFNPVESPITGYGGATDPAQTSDSLIQLLNAGADPNVAGREYSSLDSCLDPDLPHIAAILMLFGADPELRFDPDLPSPLEKANRSKKTRWFVQLVEATSLNWLARGS